MSDAQDWLLLQRGYFACILPEVVEDEYVIGAESDDDGGSAQVNRSKVSDAKDVPVNAQCYWDRHSQLQHGDECEEKGALMEDEVNKADNDDECNFPCVILRLCH